MISHIFFTVSSLESAKDFYLSALAPLDYKVVKSFPGVYGLGAKGVPDLWLSSGECGEGKSKEPLKGLHMAFLAESRELVDQFHEAALFVLSLLAY